MARAFPATLRARTQGRAGFWARCATVASNAALLLGGVGTSVIVSRLLGPDGRGAYVTWQAWAGAIGLASFAGLPQVVVLDNWSSRRHHFMDLAVPLMLTTALGSTIVIALGLSVFGAGVQLLGMALAVAAFQAAGVAASEAQRLGHMVGEFNVVRLLPVGVGLLTIGALGLSPNRDPAIWVAAVGGVQAIALTASLLWVTRPIRFVSEARGNWRKMLVESARLGPATWITLVQYRADLLAVSLIFPPNVVGYYAVGLAAQSAVSAIGQVGGQHRFARGSVGHTGSSLSLRGELLATVGLSCVSGLVIGATAEWWIREAYGQAFLPALPLVIAMSAVGVLQSVDYLMLHEMLLLGRGAQLALYRLPAALVLVLGFLVVNALGQPPLVAVACSAAGYAASVGLMAFAAARFGRPVRTVEGPSIGG